jgi:hypothetical protein
MSPSSSYKRTGWACADTPNHTTPTRIGMAGQWGLCGAHGPAQSHLVVSGLSPKEPVLAWDYQS